MTKAPGPVSSGCEGRREEPPDPAAAALGAEQVQVEDLEQAEEPDEGDRDPRERRAPAGAGLRAGPHSRYQPAASSRNGSSQRPVPNHGAIESRHQSGQAPWPGSSEARSA